MFHKSVAVEQNPALTRVAFLDPASAASANAGSTPWPDFYLFVTSTRAKARFELAEGEEQRVQDGLIYSEFFLSKFIEFELMTSEVDMLAFFLQNTGELMQDIAYPVGSSSVFESTEIDDTMQFQAS